MISFIIPFSTYSPNLANWPQTDNGLITLSTILAIQNINKTIHEKKEIILVDSTDSFPSLEMDNLKIVKGFQNYSKEKIYELGLDVKYGIDDFTTHSGWAAIAYNIGIDHSNGQYIVLQHNDVFYHMNPIKEFKKLLRKYEYISVDSKKLSLTGYFANKESFQSIDSNFELSYEDGGYVKTTDFGLADAYFFMARKTFFNDYSVDYAFGDTNHGATIKCIKEEKDFLHLEPYYDNPNFETNKSDRTYYFENRKFLTHLKGGFSEHKFSHKINNSSDKMSDLNNYLSKLIDTL